MNNRKLEVSLTNCIYMLNSKVKQTINSDLDSSNQSKVENLIIAQLHNMESSHLLFRNIVTSRTGMWMFSQSRGETCWVSITDLFGLVLLHSILQTFELLISIYTSRYLCTKFWFPNFSSQIRSVGHIVPIYLHGTGHALEDVSFIHSPRLPSVPDVGCHSSSCLHQCFHFFFL